ncbi:MAG: hypothetical protein NC420_12175 [Eubacterium sp.]|nr:hypothetical protein [Eubacterium sp.]MCM1304114.1 hypothetical protein [Butyrivibrio sp.]MCM1344072.1 hypothetical protein [Muribaculaceae bacterium]MCM1408963.1 hypothetical protein [Lachnospiraceae bacterium]
MQRKVKDLQDAVNSIHISETMQREIIRNVKAGVKGKRRRFPRAAAAALALLLLGTVSIPGRAVVQSFLQARVEDMTEEERTTMLDNLNRGTVNADSQTRPYTEEEKRKFKELFAQYKEGRFPEGELAQVETEEEAEKLGFCFLIPICRFYLPDRELTEEEMLRVIDFYVKRDYALRQYVEENHPEWIVDPKRDLEQKKEEIVADGGLSEEGARKIADEWLLEIYGVHADSLECQSFLSENVPIGDKQVFYRMLYMGSENQPYYALHIDVEDGSLDSAGRYDESGEETQWDIGEAKALLPGLARTAASFAKERLGMAYEDVYPAYYTVNDVLHSTVTFYFVDEGSSAFIMEYSWDGTFRRFQKYLFSSWQEEYEKIKKSTQWREEYGRKEEITVELFFEKMEDKEELSENE